MTFMKRTSLIKLFLSELLVRTLALALMSILFFLVKPFNKVIQTEEWWLYQNPVKPDTVKIAQIAIYVFLWPSVGFITSYIFNKRKLAGVGVAARSKNSAGERNSEPLKSNINISINFHTNDLIDGFLSYSLGLILTLLITESIKSGVGRPRPDYFNRCFPNIDLNNDTAVQMKIDSLGLEFACEADGTYSKHFVKDGRKSFPSGHSSIIWLCFTYTSLYIWGKTRAFTKRYKHESWRFCSGLLLLLYPLYVSISRTQDYRHHYQDVLVGSLIGIICAYTSYKLYYPCLDDEFCNYSDRQILWRVYDYNNYYYDHDFMSNKKNQQLREQGEDTSTQVFDRNLENTTNDLLVSDSRHAQKPVKENNLQTESILNITKHTNKHYLKQSRWLKENAKLASLNKHFMSHSE